MNAHVAVTRKGRAVLSYALEGEQRITATLKVSNLPNWFDRPDQNIVGIATGTDIHLSPEVRSWLYLRLAALLAHEWRHVWQGHRYGIWGFRAMAVWRIFTKGYRRSDLEIDADAFGAAHRAAFLAAAVALLSSEFFDR